MFLSADSAVVLLNPQMPGCNTTGIFVQGLALNGGNIFAELMSTVRVASLGQITHALYEVGGRYRRAM